MRLIFLLSIKGLSSIAISQPTGLSENTIAEWRLLLHTRISDWLCNNPFPLGGPGVIVELDEPKFNKLKMEIHQGIVQRGSMGTGSSRPQHRTVFSPTLPWKQAGRLKTLPVIQRWILPGSVVYTDEWAAYSGLTASCYTHYTLLITVSRLSTRQPASIPTHKRDSGHM